MVPASAEGHLQLNARRLKKYGDVRVEIYAYFESCIGNIVEPRTREVALDVDSLVKGNSKGKREGEGKGYGKQ